MFINIRVLRLRSTDWKSSNQNSFILVPSATRLKMTKRNGGSGDENETASDRVCYPRFSALKRYFHRNALSPVKRVGSSTHANQCQLLFYVSRYKITVFVNK